MGSATTTCWGREASTSSPGAPTSWRGSCRPRPGARARSRGREGGTLPRPHPWAPLHGGAALVPGRPGHRAVLRRALGRGRLPAGGPQAGAATSLAYRPPAGVVASSTPTDASVPSSRPPTTETIRASASTASRDAFTPLGPSCGSGSASTATPPRWTGCRCFTVRTPASGSRTRSRNRHELPFRRQGSNRDMPYCLDNAFLLDNPWITVVGCGGTGGFVAEGLCRLLQGRQATIVLVDHDRVEPHNLLRQNYYPEDEGRFKSQALADRLAKAYRRPVGYSVYLFRDEDSRPDGHRYPGLPSPTATPCSSAAPTTPPRGVPWPRACRVTPAGGSSTRATSPTRFPGTNPPPGIRRWLKPKANLGPRMRASVRSCRCCPLR